MAERKRGFFSFGPRKNSMTRNERIKSDIELTELENPNASWVGERHITHNLPDIWDSAPFDYSFLLNGISFAKASVFAETFHNQLISDMKNSVTSSWSIAPVLKTLTSKLLPGREFYSQSPKSFELQYEFLPAYRDARNIRAAIRDAHEEGVPLEFGYASYRAQRSGMPKEEVHIRRVNVTSVDGTGFVGTHGRGTRRFNFAHVTHAAQATELTPSVWLEPMMKLALRHVDGQTQLVTYLGRQGDNGALLLGTTPKSKVLELHMVTDFRAPVARKVVRF